MAKFGINDILNAKTKAAGQQAQTDGYKEIYLSPYEVKAAQENTHQKLENIEELADSFLHVGQEQPTVLARVNGEYRIIDGHRRNAANILNLERGHKEYEKVLYRFMDMSEANKMATISDIVAPSNEYIYASGANELTVVEGCVIAVGGAGIFKTANTILTAANLDAGSAFAVGKDYYVYICDSRIDSADEKYVISLNSTYPTGWNATNSRKIGGFHYGRCRKVDSNLQPLNGSSVIFGTGWESAVSNGIVPRSVWTLGHRPKCSPEGMVYLGGGT